MKKYIHLLLFLTLTSLIILSVFGVYFLYQKIQSALHSQERIQLEQEIQAEQIKNLPELASHYQQILENEHYFKILYSEDKLVDVIKDIERLAKEQGVSLTITQKEVEKKKAPPKKQEAAGETSQTSAGAKELAGDAPYEKSIRLELKAEGSYLALRNFLHAVETAPYALDVLALQGSVAPPEEGDRPVVRAQSDNPFLLSGNQSVAVEPTPRSDKILFLIETALYVQ